MLVIYGADFEAYRPWPLIVSGNQFEKVDFLESSFRTSTTS